MGDAALLVGRMEEGATSQGCGASRSWKRQEMDPPPTPRARIGTSPAHAWVQPRETGSDSLLQDHQGTNGH